MLAINQRQLSVDFDQFSGRMHAMATKQLPYAQSLALNWIAQDVRDAEVEEMQRVFDNPVRFTLNSLYLKAATKSKPEARVWFKDWTPKGTPASKYLQAEVHGGRRKAKRFERALYAKGILKPGRALIPTGHARRNKHGNVSRGQFVKLLSNVGGHSESGYTANSTRKTRSRGPVFFVARNRNGEVMGVYRRHGRKVKPWFVADELPTYHARYDFYAVARRVFQQQAGEHFSTALRRALATAR